MKLSDLFFWSVDDERYIIDEITEIDVARKLIAIVGKQPSSYFQDTPEPLVGIVDNNSLRVWGNGSQLDGPGSSTRQIEVYGEFRNISSHDNKTLLKLEFAVASFYLLGSIAGTFITLVGILMLLQVIGQSQSGFAVIVFGVFTRGICDLITVIDTRRIRNILLSAFRNHKLTRVLKANPKHNADIKPATDVR